jgi:hypothetical protein
VHVDQDLAKTAVTPIAGRKRPCDRRRGLLGKPWRLVGSRTRLPCGRSGALGAVTAVTIIAAAGATSCLSPSRSLLEVDSGWEALQPSR